MVCPAAGVQGANGNAYGKTLPAIKMGGVPYDVQRLRVIPGGKAAVTNLFGKEHTIFTEALLESSPLFKPFAEYELFSAEKTKVSILDAMSDWSGLVKAENISIIKGIVTFGFEQIAVAVSQGYTSDTKLSRKVKDDLSNIFKEETENFLDTLLFPLFPVDTKSRKWLMENVSNLRTTLKPTCAIKKDSKESHQQLQAKIIEDKIKAAGITVEEPPRRSGRKTNLETKPSPPEKQPPASRAGTKSKKPKTLAFPDDDNTEEDLSSNLRKLFTQASKGGANAMEMVALKAVMDYKLKEKEDKDKIKEEEASNSSSVHTAILGGKARMSASNPSMRSPSDTTVESSAATLEATMQIRERDMKIEYLEKELKALTTKMKEDVSFLNDKIVADAGERKTRESMLEAKIETLQESLGESRTKASFLQGKVEELELRNGDNKEKYTDAKLQAEKFNERLFTKSKNK